MMDRLGIDAVLSGRLGGWTQTSLTMETSAAKNATREFRMMRGACVICGLSGCSADAHKLDNKSSGKRRESQPTAAALPTKRVRNSPSDGDSQLNSVRASPAPPAPRRQYPRVQALGHEYTFLAWFLQKRPNDSQIARAIQHCGERALELSSGDSKTLKTRDFVSQTNASAPELLPGRRNLPSSWVATACLIPRSTDFLSARRAVDIRSCRQILWPCASKFCGLAHLWRQPFHDENILNWLPPRSAETPPILAAVAKA